MLTLQANQDSTFALRTSYWMSAAFFIFFVMTVTKLSARLAYSFNKNETNAIMDLLMMDEGMEEELRMEASNRILSAPLQQLKDEHVSLREEMNRFYEITEEIEFESGPAVLQEFTRLYEQIQDFNIKLKAHSKKEDDWLFPMMASHLGENDRTIEVMEFEHEKAEQHLQDFLTEAEQAGSTIDEDEAQAIAVYAVQAYATLIQHFDREEKVLFPLAEKILSAGEMEELERRFRG